MNMLLIEVESDFLLVEHKTTEWEVRVLKP